MSRFKIVASSLTGSAIEWYDFSIYGTAAALVFPKLFFPNFSPLAGTLLSFSTFAIAFVARPLGGVVFGHYGDRIGRKSTLVITLVTMGLSTFLIGLLPSFSAIGVAAPILLVTLRFVQGFSLGGEYSGAILMTVESAPPDRRGLLGSIVQMGPSVGFILAQVAFLVVGSLEGSALYGWGWRVPFLLSSALVLVGLVIRLSLTETDDFAAARNRGEVRKLPISEVLRKHLRTVLLIGGGYVSTGVTFYGATVFGLAYGKETLKIPHATMITLLILTNVVALIALPFFGRLSDRVGRKAVFLGGIIVMAVMAYPWLLLLGTASFWPAMLGYALLILGYSASYGAMGTYYAEVFPPAVRFSGYALGYTLGTILGSALAPIISTYLREATGGVTAIAVYMVVAGVLSFLSVLGLSTAARTLTTTSP